MMSHSEKGGVGGALLGTVDAPFFFTFDIAQLSNVTTDHLRRSSNGETNESFRIGGIRTFYKSIKQ